MNETIETITVEGDGLTVAHLVWRRFKKASPGMVERILDINPGLAAYGEYMPVGLAVKVPIPAPRQTAIISPVRLWG